MVGDDYVMSRRLVALNIHSHGCLDDLNIVGDDYAKSKRLVASIFIHVDVLI
jgi:hypothetical protein